jgi:hypothetical protein
MTFPIYMYIGNEDVHVLIYLLFGLLIMSQLDVEYCVLNHFVNVHVRKLTDNGCKEMTIPQMDLLAR